MSLSSPTSLIPIALIIGFVLLAVWIQVRTRLREKRAISNSERPNGPVDLGRHAETQDNEWTAQARIRNQGMGRP